MATHSSILALDSRIHEFQNSMDRGTWWDGGSQRVQHNYATKRMCTRTHAHTHARAHTRTRTHTHARTHTHCALPGPLLNTPQPTQPKRTLFGILGISQCLSPASSPEPRVGNTETASVTSPSRETPPGCWGGEGSLLQTERVKRPSHLLHRPERTKGSL